MRVMMKVLLAIIVVCMIVLVYWATVGFSVAIDDFQGGDDPPDDDDDDDDDDDSGGTDTEAKAYFVIQWRAWVVPSTSYTSVYISGLVNSITPYVSAGIPVTQLYETQKFNLLSPYPGEPSAGEAWLEVKVTGPNGYSAAWTSDPKLIRVSATSSDPVLVDTMTGYCYFSTKGTYTVSVVLKSKVADSNVILNADSKSQTFEVSV